MAYGYPYQPGGMPNYFNTNYMPPAPQMNMNPPAPTQNAQAQSTPGSNVTWIYVNGMAGAREQIVQPGQTAWMMDNNEPVIFVKSVDTMGSAKLRAFRLDEITERANAPESGQYASANDMNTMNERISRLETAFGGLMNELGGVKKHEPVGADCGQAGGK